MDPHITAKVKTPNKSPPTPQICSDAVKMPAGFFFHPADGNGCPLSPVVLHLHRDGLHTSGSGPGLHDEEDDGPAPSFP